MQFTNETPGLAARLDKSTGNLRRLEAGEGEKAGWLDELKAELEAKRQAEAEAQYRRDAMITRLMFELTRVHCVELLEEMNRELLNREGRVEPVYTDRHELCFSWPVAGGRNQITVGADYDEESHQAVLIVTGQEIRRTPVEENALKVALIKAFREPLFSVYRW
jgi:hypothetical protein